MSQRKKFDPTEFLYFAEELIKFEGVFDYVDAKIRTVLSRCYYAVFLNCALRVLGLKPTQKLDHEKVFRKIKNKGELGRIVAKELDYLWIYRKAADYYPDTPYTIMGREREKTVLCSEREAEDAINKVKRALEKIGILKPS